MFRELNAVLLGLVRVLGSNRDVHMERLLELWSCLRYMLFYLAELASCMYIPAKMKTLTPHSLVN